MSKHFYAQWDSFVGMNPKDFNHGFCNTVESVAFRSKEDRSKWLQNTKYLNAKPLTRNQAFKKDMLTNDSYHYYIPIAIYVFDTDEFEFSDDKVIVSEMY